MSTPAPDATFTPATGLLAGLELLQISQDGAVLHIRLNRPVKRNAINDGLIAQLHTAFVNLPADVRAVVVSGEGAHFCAGLDLSELVERDSYQREDDGTVLGFTVEEFDGGAPTDTYRETFSFDCR